MVVTRGLDRKEVAKRELPKSSCRNNFLGPEVLDTRLKLERSLRCLVNELAERAEGPGPSITGWLQVIFVNYKLLASVLGPPAWFSGPSAP